MKKITLPFAFTIIAGSTFAQQIPNPSFENWEITSDSSPHDDKPNDWNTVNSSLSAILASTLSQTCFQSTDAHTGTYSAKFKTVSPPLPSYPNVNGIGTTGSINTTTYGVDGGLSFTSRPDSLVGWYKCSPVNGDSPTIEFVVKDAQEDTIGHAKFVGSTTDVSTWTRFAVPVDYRNSDTPSIGVAFCSASNGFSSQIGSELWVDDLELIYNPVGIDQFELDFGAYYAHQNIHIVSEQTTGSVELYDLGGKLVHEAALSPSIAVKLQPGVYLVKLNAGDKVGTKKISVE